MQRAYISEHDSCMQSWGHSLEPGLSGWIWSRSPLPSSCHPHTAVTRPCDIDIDIDCGWSFCSGGGTVTHITSPSVSLSHCLSLSLTNCLPSFICLSLSLRHPHMHINLRRSMVWNSFKKPQSLRFAHPTLIAPHRLTCACTHTHTHTCAHTL